MAWSDPRGSPVGCPTTHRRGLPVSRYSLYPHVLPSLSRRSVRLPLPLASPDVSAFPTSSDGVDLRIIVFGICSTFTARCGPCGRRTTQGWPTTPKALTASLPPRPLRLLPAGEAVAGWGYLPLRERTFPRRTELQISLPADESLELTAGSSSVRDHNPGNFICLVIPSDAHDDRRFAVHTGI